MNIESLIKKYNAAVPRYTSYPSVPYWKTTPTVQEWFRSIEQKTEDNAFSLYLHMPFCETLCTFCGCTKIITKDHNQEGDYISLLKKEFSIYMENCPSLKTKKLRQIHLGGGSPTFFSAQNLKDLSEYLLKDLSIDRDHFEGSIEVDPRRVNLDQLQVLRELGYNRVSLGVQDFNPVVQKIVNRIQPLELTANVTKMSRDLGYMSVNFDLIYGLPKQTLETMRDTLEKTIELRPDRIAFYSFAYVPWIKPSQKLFKDEDLPNSQLKWDMHELAREMFLRGGYEEIGMDHFALPEDALSRARKTNSLYRNFMGYTDQKISTLIGLGMSAISETCDCYHQNYKGMLDYSRLVVEDKLPTERGHILTSSERDIKKQIQELLILFKTKVTDQQIQEIHQHQDYFDDGLIRVQGHELLVTEKGAPFIRNVCALLDPDYQHQNDGKFSQSI